MAAAKKKPAMIADDCGILQGRQAILDYLKIGIPLFYTLVKSGMPVGVIEGRVYAHAANLDEWFRAVTRQRVKDIEGAE